MYAATFGCMYVPFGCMSMARLGAKSAVVGCKVCGCWVQSMRMLGAYLRKLLGACMRLLGASLIRLIACLPVGSYTLHVYPVAWAQGPPGPWPKGSQPRPLAQMY